MWLTNIRLIIFAIDISVTVVQKPFNKRNWIMFMHTLSYNHTHRNTLIMLYFNLFLLSQAYWSYVLYIHHKCFHVISDNNTFQIKVSTYVVIDFIPLIDSFRKHVLLYICRRHFYTYVHVHWVNLQNIYGKQ